MSNERTGNSYDRKVDQVGRIVLPTELRKTLNIEENDTLIMEVVGNSIHLTPTKTHMAKAVGNVIHITPISENH